MKHLDDQRRAVVRGRTICLDLWYPRLDGEPNAVELGLVDVRAADDIRISYDFTRDGWIVQQASRFSWDNDDPYCDPDWQEVAFVQAWAREAPDQPHNTSNKN